MDTDVSPRSGSQAPAPRKARRGFNLIEAAIVLGVVGLVIGAIWVAAAAVYENFKVANASSMLLTAADNASRVIPLALTFGPNNTELELTDIAIAMKLVPDDFIQGNSIVDPWGHTMRVHTPLGNGVNHLPRIDFTFYSIPKSSCIRLVSSLWGTWPLLIGFWFPGTSTAIGYVEGSPLDMPAIISNCNASDDVVFSFRIFPQLF